MAPACAASGERAVSLSPMVTSSGRTPSSSAAICASTVRMPSPISVTPVTTFADAAVVDLDPGAGAIDRRGAGDPVPAAGHAASAFACHYSAASSLPSFAPSAANRAPRRARVAHALTGEIGARVAARRRRALFPLRAAFGGFQHAQIADRFELLLGVGLRAVAHRIDAADFERIEPEPLGADIEMGFGRELRLQRAERPEGAGRRVVGVDAVGIDLQVRNVVGPGAEDRGLAHHAFGRQPVGAAVADHLQRDRLDAAVARQAHPQRGARGMALRRRRDRFLAGEDQPHRPPRLHRHQGQHALIDHVFLAAEAAADRRHDEAHLVDRLRDDLRQHVAVMGDVLARRHDGDDAVVVDIAEPRLRLEIGVLDRLGLVILLDHEIGLREALPRRRPCGSECAW